MYKNSIKDCLHNLSLSENNNKNITKDQINYYRGLIVGIVSTLAQDCVNFDLAYFIMCQNLPKDCIDLNLVLPDSWKDK